MGALASDYGIETYCLALKTAFVASTMDLSSFGLIIYDCICLFKASDDGSVSHIKSINDLNYSITNY